MGKGSRISCNHEIDLSYSHMSLVHQSFMNIIVRLCKIKESFTYWISVSARNVKKVCLLQIGKTWKQQLESLLIYTKDANLSLRVIPQKFIQYLQYLRSKNWSKTNAWRSVTIYNIKIIWSSKFQFLLGLIWSCIMKF